MNRARPEDLRKCAEMANVLIRAGVRFIPMPALSDEDFAELARQSDERMTKIIEDTEASNA